MIFKFLSDDLSKKSNNETTNLPAPKPVSPIIKGSVELSKDKRSRRLFP